MPIIVQGNAPASGGCFPTAGDIIDSVAQDLLQRLAPEDPVLLDYINRIQLQLLRVSRWQFLLSAPQRFITKKDRTDYWIGSTGSAPLDTVDTGLNVINNGPIKTDTFYDRSNFRLLKRTSEALLTGSMSFRDASSRPGIPRAWRNDVSTPSIINLYPAPDNQNNYQPVPEAPVLASVPGGALPARIYFARTTFVDSLGNESSASDEARIFIPANYLITVQPPQEIPAAASGVRYDSYNVYLYNAGTNITLPNGAETLVTASPFNSSTVYQEPNTGFVTGGIPFPTENNVEQLGGYLIEFRYYQAKPQVTSITQPLLIPCDYRDVLIAGVNYFAAQKIKDQFAVEFWKNEYEMGKIGMIRDKNLFPKGPEFISPDPASQQLLNYFGFETFDEWYVPTS